MNKILFFLLFPVLIFSQEIDSLYELVSYDIYKNKQIDKGIKEVKIAKLLIEFKI